MIFKLETRRKAMAIYNNFLNQSGNNSKKSNLKKNLPGKLIFHSKYHLYFTKKTDGITTLAYRHCYSY